MTSRWLRTLAAVVLMMGGASRTAVASPANDTSPLGINLSGVNYWTEDWFWVDLMKGASWWVDGNAWGEMAPAFSYDAQGWVTSLNGRPDAVTVVPTQEGGNIVILYEGDGDFTAGGLSNASGIRPSGGQPGELRIPNTSRNGTFIISISRTNASNYLRNFHVYREAEGSTVGGRFVAPTGVFNPVFLDHWRNFRVLRFMDWQNTNHNPVVSWSERSRPDRYSFSNPIAGVPLEVMIDLANTLDADPWFCIPHMANDDYIRQFAAVVRDRLNPNLKAYIEYSNETWNWAFDQQHWVEAQGLAAGLGEGADTSIAQFRFHSRRSVQMFRIFNEAFTGNPATPSPRLVRVFGAFLAGYTDEMLSFENGYQQGDAVAIAPYFGYAVTADEGNLQGMNTTWTVDQLLNATEASMADLFRPGGYVETSANAIHRYGLRMISYEGGQHLVSPPAYPRAIDLIGQANRNPRMKTIYLDYLARWRQAGGELFSIFSSVGNWGQYGFWGVMEYQDQSRAEAVKYDATLDFISSNPRWWDGGTPADTLAPARPRGLRVR